MPKTVCQSVAWFKRYKTLKSVTVGRSVGRSVGSLNLRKFSYSAKTRSAFGLARNYFGADFIIFIKIAGFSSFSFLIVSTTCTGIPYKFLSISKLVRTLSVVSVVVATPLRRTTGPRWKNQDTTGRIRSPYDKPGPSKTNHSLSERIRVPPD